MIVDNFTHLQQLLNSLWFQLDQVSISLIF